MDKECLKCGKKIEDKYILCYSCLTKAEKEYSVFATNMSKNNLSLYSGDYYSFKDWLKLWISE